MAIKVSAVQNNGGLLPDIILLDPVLLPSGDPLKCHEEVLSLQPMMSPKRFDIFPPDWGMLRRSRCVQIFLLKKVSPKPPHVKMPIPDFVEETPG